MRVVLGVHFRDVHLQNARGVVHRTALKTGEGQNGDMARLHTGRSLKFHAAGALIANQVGIGAAQAGGAHGFVAVYHQVVLGAQLHAVQEVVHHPLVAVVAGGEDVAHIAGLDKVVAVVMGKGVGLVHVPLVVGHRPARLMVHDEPHAFAPGVRLQLLNGKVGVGTGETVVVVFLPRVFPTAVPAFHKQSRKTVLAGVVDVAHHILAARTVTSRGGESGKVGRVGVHGLVVGVVPGALAGHHLPPHTHILGGVNPRGVS